MMPSRYLRASFPRPRLGRQGLVLGCTIAICLAVFWQPLAAAPTDGDLANATSQAMPDWIKPPEFAYSSEGKPDPFQPFIEQNEGSTEQSAKADKPQRPLTPLERVQPSQLNLEGILWDSKKPGQAMALVKLPDGKGYVLKKGTRIGRHQGRVVQIKPDQVVIQEEVTSIFGEEEEQNVVLKLHKSGEGNE